VVLALLASTPAVGTVAQADPADARVEDTHLVASPRLLHGPARGERAIRRLGDRLSVAAARNDLRAGQLRSLLRDDTTAWVDRDGRVYFVEPALETTGPSAPTAPAVAPLAETFSLHSNPGADLTIFLDVDGADVSGTAWNDGGVTPGQHPAWDPAGDGAGFSDDELLVVQQVWAIVAEDYAPFGVDVTTEDPGHDGLVRTDPLDTTYGTRVLISPSDDALDTICGGGCGGVAYVDVFDEVASPYQPAWVFPQALGGAKSVAEAASHEAGHNLGLRHDGTSTLGYYAGHGSWAPIMGVGYYKPIAQWSHGAYPGANNSAQDDVAVLAGYLGRRTDEAPDAVDAPPALPTGTAYITDASDVDTFLLGSCVSGAVVEVTPAPLAPNLDVRAVLRAGDGSVVATSAPASGGGDGTTASGLGATVTVPSTGTGWTVSVEGVGEGSWSAGGYDDYGSLGAYTVSAAGCGDNPLETAPSAPQDAAAGSAALGSLTLSWSAPADPGSSPVTSYVVSRSGTTRTWTLPATARSHVFTALTAGTPYALSVRAVNATGAGPVATASGTTLAPPPAVPSAPRNVTSSYDAGTDAITVWWAEPSSSGTQPVSGYAIYLDGVRLGEVGQDGRNVTITDESGFAEGTHTVGVAAVNAVGESTRATATVVVDRPDAVPAAPLLTMVMSGDGAASVSWTAPADNGSAITGYTVIARSTWEVDRRYAVPASALGTTLTGLTNGVTWTISVTATNGVGTSAESQALAVTPVGVGDTGNPPPTPTPTPSPTPTSVPTPATPISAAPLRMAPPKVKVKGRKVTVKWAAATSSTSAVRTYLVDLSKGTDRSAKGSARKLVLKLRPGKYKIRVAALNATGWSPSSRWVKVRVR
jgi:hypothetical protein